MGEMASSAGLETATFNPFEGRLSGFTTATTASPSSWVAAGSRVVCRAVSLRNVVGHACPFQKMVAPSAKRAPITLRSVAPKVNVSGSLLITSGVQLEESPQEDWTPASRQARLLKNLRTSMPRRRRVPLRIGTIEVCAAAKTTGEVVEYDEDAPW